MIKLVISSFLLHLSADFSVLEERRTLAESCTWLDRHSLVETRNKVSIKCVIFGDSDLPFPHFSRHESLLR